MGERKGELANKRERYYLRNVVFVQPNIIQSIPNRIFTAYVWSIMRCSTFNQLESGAVCVCWQISGNGDVDNEFMLPNRIIKMANLFNKYLKATQIPTDTKHSHTNTL